MRRFWDKVQVGDGCWLWQAAKTQNGYGLFWSGQKKVLAHRWSYEACVGPIPEEHEIDHLCDVRACVRPDHLALTTHRANVLRGTSYIADKARQTTCIRGHELDARDGRGHRFCRTCSREKARRRQLANPHRSHKAKPPPEG